MPLLKVLAVARMFSRYNPTSRPCLLEGNSRRYIRIHAPKLSSSKTKLTMKQEKEKLRTYVIQRYMEYLKSYKKVLETKFPTAMNMYRVFSVGIKDFYNDLKLYISLRIKTSRDKGFYRLSRQEIELYDKMPSDMLRIAPVLILSAIPFGNYLIFPLAFLKPRSLLCSHFWSIQQRSEFSLLELRDRLKHNRPVFRALQAKLDLVPAGEVGAKWRSVIAMLGSGTHPEVEDILRCKELFVTGPYNLHNLSFSHLGHLQNMHGLKKNLFREKKLKYRSFLLLQMDQAIIREGGTTSMNTESLRNACLIRGLNVSTLSNQDLMSWLDRWLQISEQVDKDSYSLLLHCPLLLAYNHPQNWVLIYY